MMYLAGKVFHEPLQNYQLFGRCPMEHVLGMVISIAALRNLHRELARSRH